MVVVDPGVVASAVDIGVGVVVAEVVVVVGGGERWARVLRRGVPGGCRVVLGRRGGWGLGVWAVGWAWRWGWGC